MVHRLSLLDTSPYSSGRFICNICHESSCGPVYHCPDCEFDVHVTCAATAKQQTHISHPQHLLHLAQCPTLHHTCDSCGTRIHTLSFRCDMCDFDIHPTCVRAPRYIKHRSHPHPLTLSKSSTASDLLRCDGCKMPVTNLFYRCNIPVAGLQGSCNYILHQVCASLPSKVKHPKHQQHFLQLLDQPSQEKPFSCGGCGAQSKGWRFNCTVCNFNLHPGCATTVHEFVQLHQDPEIITQDKSEETSSSTTPVVCKAADASALHAVSSQVPVPSDKDLEAFKKVLHFARETVQGHSLLNAIQDSAQSCMNGEDTCSTCFEGYDLGNPKKLTNCGHHFHLACILQWMERSSSCPICRKCITIPM